MSAHFVFGHFVSGHFVSRRSLIACTLAPLALAGCQYDKPADRPAVAPAARITGAPASCIPLAQVRETKVRDDWTIDFIGAGKRVWRNTLTARCPGLKVNNAITYATSISQLCTPDIVYVLENRGNDLSRGAACSLGPFVPVELAD